jgi:lipoate-protein ligase B
MPRPLLALRVLRGLAPYGEAHALQRATVEQRKAGAVPDTLILLEHPPVITLGRNAAERGVTASSAELAAAGIEVHRIERGGEATYHGPGQIVGYPIVNLHELRIGVASYVRNLEETMIRAAAALGVESFRYEKLTGVFTEHGKVGAIGVRVTRGVTYHGFAFNVDPDLTHYRLIVPCGMTGMPVTSVAQLLRGAGEAPPLMDAARAAIVAAFLEVFGMEQADEGPDRT